MWTAFNIFLVTLVILGLLALLAVLVGGNTRLEISMFGARVEDLDPDDFPLFVEEDLEWPDGVVFYDPETSDPAPHIPHRGDR